MFGWFGVIKYVLILSIIAGGVGYVYKLRADNAVLKANAIKMEMAYETQQKTIEKQKADFQEILEANKQMNILVQNLKEDLQNLDKRFNKNNTDIGKLAEKKPGLVVNIINGATERAKRCVELASGAEHTEAELKATKKSEINPECPAIANPNYVPYAVE